MRQPTQRFTIWLKAIPLPQPENFGKCAAAWRLEDEERLLEQAVSTAPNFPQGPALRVLVETLNEKIKRLPKGSEIVLASNDDSLWKAFHPDHEWLKSWRKDGFTKKPDHDKDAWRRLAEMVGARLIIIIVQQPLTKRDKEILADLRILARTAADPDYDPFAKEDDSESADALFKRAIERDI